MVFREKFESNIATRKLILTVKINKVSFSFVKAFKNYRNERNGIKEFFL